MTHPGNFLALDFETADYERDSACSIGLVRVRDGQIVDRKHILIQPPRRQIVFTYIHGITWEHVKAQPKFAALWPILEPELNDADYLVAHNSGFDEGVMKACCLSAGVAPPKTPYLCTVKLARKAWKLFPTKLPDVCRHLKIDLKHHDALSDAEACARVILALQAEGKHNLLGIKKPKKVYATLPFV